MMYISEPQLWVRANHNGFIPDNITSCDLLSDSSAPTPALNHAINSVYSQEDYLCNTKGGAVLTWYHGDLLSDHPSKGQDFCV